MIRVLVVDDSQTACKLLRGVLESDPSICVVGTAGDGLQAVKQVLALKPDLVTMDLNMPVLDGYEATRRIMEARPTPIVVVSTLAAPKDQAVTFQALKAGALDVVLKPTGSASEDYAPIRERLLSTVKTMSQVKVLRRRATGSQAGMASAGVGSMTHEGGTAALAASAVTSRPPKLVVIGSSTGGPAALAAFIKPLTAAFPIPIAVAQHITPGFLGGLVEWLQRETVLPIEIVNGRTPLRGGRIYLPKDDHHLIVADPGALDVNQGPLVSYVRPSATVLFESAARQFGASVAGVILTGMGDDGAIGMRTLKQHGAITFAQNEATCVVYGMPRAAVELGVVDVQLPPEAICKTIMEIVSKANRGSASMVSEK